MDKQKMIDELYQLNDKIDRVNVAKKNFEKAKKQLSESKKVIPKSVENFDRNNRESYIRKQIGAEPIKPGGIVKLAVPKYIAQKKEYKKKLEEYNQRYCEMSKKYYIEFADTRNRLEINEKEKISKGIKQAESEKIKAQKEFEIANNELNSDTLLSEKLKEKEIISDLIEYFNEGRAETMKEAINIYYEEKHRRELETIAKEQARLTKEAREIALQAANDAKKASDRADEAYDRADEAYHKARDAYSKAEEVSN